jgi:RHS repeat-associated protein
LRRQKKVNGSVTHYIWDEQNLLQEKDASLQTKVQYTTQPHSYGPLLSQRRFGATSPQSAQFNKVRFASARFNQSKSSAAPKSTFYGTDLSGNVRNLTDSSGAVTDRYVTTAFGKLVSSTGSTTNPYRFGGAVGYYQDNAQRYYVRKRYLNTNQARWISPDPIGFNGRDWNLYRYVGNNPGNNVDPTGAKSSLCSEWHFATGNRPDYTRPNTSLDWNSKHRNLIDVAKFKALKTTFELLFPVGLYPEMWGMFEHWLNDTGTEYFINMKEFLRVSSAERSTCDTLLTCAAKFAENHLGPGQERTIMTNSQGRNIGNLSSESFDWFFAVGNHTGFGKALAKTSDGCSYSLSFTWRLEDAFTFHNKAYFPEMNEYHLKGLAKDFLVTGVFQKTYKWKKGSFKGKCQ